MASHYEVRVRKCILAIMMTEDASLPRDFHSQLLSSYLTQILCGCFQLNTHITASLLLLLRTINWRDTCPQVECCAVTSRRINILIP